MIRSFKDKRTAALYAGFAAKGAPADVVKRAHAKLTVLAAATGIDDWRLPPSNRLEVLQGDRAGQWSVRVNAQGRICFIWRDGDAYDVEFCDYH